MPADLLPEALLGPIGYLDDLVLLALGSLPLGGRVLAAFKRFAGMRGSR
jgi:uncharacterized membrane protein YkvA (DUF1232 family)